MHEISEELKAHFLRLYSMAFTDDNFHHLELKMLYRFAEERGIPKETLDTLLLNPSTIEKSTPSDLIDKITYLYQLCEMIWADGKVDDNERNTLKKYIRLFEFEEENIDGLSEYLLDAVNQNIKLEEVLKQL
jgi:uncharacterized tellurite resistance protein B-like protein